MMVRYKAIVTFKLDLETLNKLDNLSKEWGISRSEIIRMAIGSFLAEPRVKVRVKYPIIKVKYIKLT